MRYNYEKILPGHNQTFKVHDEIGAVIDCCFHVHPEYELTYIVSSFGTRFIGDSVDCFEPGNLALIGPMAPHHYYNSPQDSLSDSWGHARVVQFRKDFAGKELFELPEMTQISRMLKDSVYGLDFSEDSARRVSPLLERLIHAHGAQRIIILLRILHTLSESDYRRLSSVKADTELAVGEDHRANNIIAYIHACLENGESPSLGKTARKAGMSPEAFSRYFRRTTFKRFIDYVNESKTGKACHALINTDKTVAEICFDAGFSNLSNFNRQFLKIKKISPRAFREQYRRTE
ncbi:MAG: helix-turn-helix domain-containing protein [Victivallales bacterium]|nr:helix-turn-helix domain-containing protein [Victivallales bacterium]